MILLNNPDYLRYQANRLKLKNGVVAVSNGSHSITVTGSDGTSEVYSVAEIFSHFVDKTVDITITSANDETNLGETFDVTKPNMIDEIEDDAFDISLTELTSYKLYANGVVSVYSGGYTLGNYTPIPQYATNFFDPSDVEDANQQLLVLSSNNVAIMTFDPSVTQAADIYRITGYVPVPAGEEIYIGQVNHPGTGFGGAFYNSQKVFIRAYDNSELNEANNVLTVPSNAAYLRHTFIIGEGYNEDWENTMYIIKNSDPHVYTPYDNLPLTVEDLFTSFVGKTIDMYIISVQTGSLGETINPDA